MTGVGFPRSHGVTPNSQDFSHPSDEQIIQKRQFRISKLTCMINTRHKVELEVWNLTRKYTLWCIRLVILSADNLIWDCNCVAYSSKWRPLLYWKYHWLLYQQCNDGFSFSEYNIYLINTDSIFKRHQLWFYFVPHQLLCFNFNWDSLSFSSSILLSQLEFAPALPL